MKICITILFLFLFTDAAAKLWRVGANQQERSIRATISKATNGDTIFIYPGIYKEGQLIITKKLVLKGIQYPVLDGEQKVEILTIRCDGVVVEGLFFKRSGRSSYNDISALRIADCRNAVVRNNRFESGYFGIYSQHATSAIITGNRLQSDAKDEVSSGNGIHCWKSDSMHISSNTVTGYRDGLYFEFVTNSYIKSNTSYGNVRYGLHFMFSGNNSYISNVFRDNGAGVAVMYSKNIRIQNNLFADNWGGAAYGILMKEITDSRVEGNRFQKNSVGVMLEGSNRIQLLRNSFIQNGWAVKMQANCMDNSIEQNNFSANSFDMATNGELILSSFKNNYWDKYEGYDLNRDGVGDVPYHPVSMFSMMGERNASSMMLFRSFIVGLLDKAEKMLPVLTPVDLKDHQPLMKPLKL